ncbi:MAG: hypothetical protein JSS79_18130 [Bacteroidetes bacterium]|nr:hypothetical protein [Bacteroidota bacterium]
MNDKQEKLLRIYCAQILVKYGFEFSPHDPVVPALYTIHCELNSNKTGNEQVAKSIGEAMKKINPTVYNFSERGEAWKFKFAESLRWLFIGLSVVLVVVVSLIWWSQYNDIRRATLIIAASKGANETFIRSAKRDSQGYVYLEFSRAKGNVVDFWTDYEEVKKDTIRVYVGKAE